MVQTSQRKLQHTQLFIVTCDL